MTTILLATLSAILPGSGDSTWVTVQPPPPPIVRRAPKRRRHRRRPVDHRIVVVRPYNAKLDRMAYCESTSRWHLNTGNGFYGGLQFDLPTWWGVGGRSRPDLNSELEQKYRAVILIHRRGYRPWPHCGYV
jgi:hypothetical protein